MQRAEEARGEHRERVGRRLDADARAAAEGAVRRLGEVDEDVRDGAGRHVPGEHLLRVRVRVRG